MKDYRQYSKPYTFDEWETDKEWIAHRLDFLWTFRDYYTSRYQAGNFGDEKELIYSYYGRDDEIGKMADQFQYGDYQKADYDLKLSDYNKIFKEYYKLEKIRKHSIDKFLKKNIYIKYGHLLDFIQRNYLEQDYRKFLHDNRYEE
ncbi:MAG TPA: hypothetical protein VIK72_19595 [Clostridiaceae bacterium]